MIDLAQIQHERADRDAVARLQNCAALHWQNWVNIAWMVVVAGLLAGVAALLDAPLAALVTG